MLNLDAYNLKDIQLLEHILNEAEADGISEIRYVRQYLHDYTHTKALLLRKVKKKPKRNTITICPSCHKRTFVQTIIDGVDVMTCSGKQKCGYSEVIK